MNNITKVAFTLFELIIVILISSIVLIYTFNFQKELFETQITNEKIAILKIDLNSTKIIIEENIKKDPKIENKLKYENKTLFFENNILLKDISSFNISKTSNILIINITLADKITQIWKFKL